MKIRNGFVSNSSSSSFIITNKSNKNFSWVEFILENEQLVRKLIDDDANFYVEKRHINIECFFLELLETASKMKSLKPGKNELTLSDDGGDIFGDIFTNYFNYGSSKSSKTISWKVDCEYW